MSEQMSQPKASTGDDVGIEGALIKARNEQGLTQAQLSEMSGISRSAIKAYETGRNMPGSRELKALCRVLKVSPTVMLYGSEESFTAQLGGETPPEEYDHTRARWQLLALARLLAADEIAALLKLMRAIAVARHGIEKVTGHLEAGADIAFALVGDELPKTIAQIAKLGAASEGDEERSSKAAKKPRRHAAK